MNNLIIFLSTNTSLKKHNSMVYVYRFYLRIPLIPGNTEMLQITDTDHSTGIRGSSAYSIIVF